MIKTQTSVFKFVKRGIAISPSLGSLLETLTVGVPSRGLLFRRLTEGNGAPMRIRAEKSRSGGYKVFASLMLF